MKKYYRITEKGKYEFSDTYDEDHGFIGLTEGMDFSKIYAFLPDDGKEDIIYGDGLSLFSQRHPRPPFFKRVWNCIKSIFVRPKFSKEAIEPAEHFITNGANQRHPASCTCYHCL